MTSFDFRAVISGRRRNPSAAFMRGLLRASSLPYAAVIGVRNRRYDRGVAKIESCGIPVISVGNLTTGGTGKTPVVRRLAEQFRGRGIRVAIISRGYGRGDADANDEALELYDRLPDVPQLQDPDRVKIARIAVDELESQLLLMDDGFQHRRLARDLDIVVVDATCPFGYGYLLPRGLLREPVKSLARASLVLLSRVSDVDAGQVERTYAEIRRWAPQTPIVLSDHRPAGLLAFPQSLLPIESLRGSKVALISAIGNPRAFELTVASCGAEVVMHMQLPDHDPYHPETVSRLQLSVRELGDRVDRVVCTHKDLVKLNCDRLGGKPLAALLVDLAIQGDDSAWNEVIDRFANLCKRQQA